jgi:UPF0755 protein
MTKYEPLLTPEKKIPVPTPPAAKPNPPRRRRGLTAVVVLLVLLALILSPILVISAVIGPGPLMANRNVVVPHGANVHEIADLLATDGVVYHPLLFRLASRYMANDALKAGEYAFIPGDSIADIVLMMREGHVVIRSFTIPEGATSAEVVRTMMTTPTLSGDIPTTPPEGSLLPETYNYSYGDSREGLLARMQKTMQATLEELWPKRDPNLLLKTPEQAVIMASLIEKETGKAGERARISGVFANRLRINMPLQSDPTVIYAIVRAKGALAHPLDHDDLAFPSPYNTYLANGLPPGPICNPGRAALEAAMHPEANDYFYFVADGSGGHVFARDLAAHNQNVTRWNAIKPKPGGAPPPVKTP